MNKKKTVLIFFVLMVIFFIYYWYRTYSTINKIYERKFGENPLLLRKYFSTLLATYTSDLSREELKNLYINLTTKKVIFQGGNESEANSVTILFPIEEIENLGRSLSMGCYYIEVNNIILKPFSNFSFMIPEEIIKSSFGKSLSPASQSEEERWLFQLYYSHCITRCTRIFGENLIAFSTVVNKTEIITDPQRVGKMKVFLSENAHLIDEIARISRDSKNLNSITFLLPFPSKDELTNLDIILSAAESYVFHANMLLLEKVPDVSIDKFEEVKLKECSKNLVYKRLKKLEKELIDTLGMNDTFDKIRKIRIKIIQDCSKELLNDTSCNFFDEISRERSIANVLSKHEIFASCLSSSLKNLTIEKS
jgi:hypothetical protein